MSKMKLEYIEKIYAGWLAKIIGIRLGAPIEGWTYEKIKNVYGDLRHYPVDYTEFAADDDSNGPLFFLRALEDSRTGFDISPQDVAKALLNYACYEKGFFWWGGYGNSTEHTAYTNLRNGIEAPRSGSIEQNGIAVAEQIGGQIFIDTWGLVTPGNPDLAAKYAKAAASVTHDGNGIYGGVFVAVCISYAFIENDIKKIIEKALTYIPADCEYARVVNAVMDYYSKNPKDWRECFRYVYENFGYDRYPGHCHIIPNTAVMILGLLYGEGDFSDTINICNMCGWDTDCNVGNIATIMGVRGGTECLDYDKWRAPINDFLACSSVVGSLNAMDIPYGAAYIARLAWAIAKEKLPEPWNTITERRIDSCHFEYPGSTHAMRVRTEHTNARNPEYSISNSDESARTGSRSLKLHVMPLRPGERVYLFKRTHYTSKDFHDSRYDPSFSPLLYPGQTIHGSAYLPEYARDCIVRLYALGADGTLQTGEAVTLKKGEWSDLAFEIPAIECGLIREAGFVFDMLGVQNERVDLTCLVDDLYFDGAPDYKFDFVNGEEDVWTYLHREISQFTKLKGLLYLEGGNLHLSCGDFGEAYTGHINWVDYSAGFAMTPIIGDEHFINVRVQGAIRSYAAGFTKNNKLAILKNDNGYSTLAETDFKWEHGKEYYVCVSARGNNIAIDVDGKRVLDYDDRNEPYLNGAVGISTRNGGHCSYRYMRIGK